MKNKFTLVSLFLSLITLSVYAANEEKNKKEIKIAGDEQSIVAKGPDGPRDKAGKVTKTKGKVYYHENRSVRSKRLKKDTQDLFVHDMLRTKKKSQAFLTLVDGSKLVLDENAVIHFNGVKRITAEKGIVLFDIKKQGQLKGLQIATKTAVIGIKGTRFMIDASNDSLKLYMKEGLVNVEAKDGGTFKHVLKQKQSYKDYLKDMFTSFSEYKQKQEEEFVEFVKSIDVPANKAISINGDKLEDIKIPDYVEKQFKLLDEFDSEAFSSGENKTTTDMPTLEETTDKTNKAVIEMPKASESSN